MTENIWRVQKILLHTTALLIEGEVLIEMKRRLEKKLIVGERCLKDMLVEGER